MIRRTLRKTAIAMTVLAVGVLATSGLALAGEIKSYSATTSDTQAGGHPDFTITSSFTEGSGFFNEKGQNDARSITTSLPTGVIGNPHAIPTCNLVAFSLGECSPASQVGIAGANPFPPNHEYVPVYNMEPKPGQAGLLAFVVQLGGTQQYIELSARTDSDYGLNAVSSSIFHWFPISELYFQLWGVPADPEHDGMRFVPPVHKDCGSTEPLGTIEECANTGASAGVAPQPFLSNPTTCGPALETEFGIEFYDHSFAQTTSAWPATTGCSQLAFSPTLTVKPTTGESDTPSGLDVDLKVPQTANPTTPSPSEIRGARVTLPEGFSLNPNAADGKVACTDADTGIGTLGPATCPEFSKVGTLSIDSSALPAPIPGAIYLGEPEPGNPYRVILAADGFGTHVKLAGSAKANPADGQIEFTLEDLPQSPLTEFNMHFFGSERGLLATPSHCGTYPVTSEFEPWDDAIPSQSSTSFFEVTSGPGGSACPGTVRPFSPRVEAGTANPTAGRHTPFKLELARADGEQNLSGLTVSTPPGFSATLKGIPYCPQSAIDRLSSGAVLGVVELAEPACPPESLIGTAVAGAGAGTHPLYTPGKVYLAGPYKGAPLSLLVVVPAVSGPYDLGNAVVRAAVAVDPATARVTTISDALPQILGGIPLRTRSIRIELDRPEFALNPTNCEPLSTDATISGSEGGSATLSSPFQVGNCANLSFEPQLSMRLSGGTNRRGHPAIRAEVQAQEGEANIRRVSVALPKGEILDNKHIGTPCTRVQFAAQSCPASSLIGTAEAVTPLLDQPLTGNVYLRTNPAHGLPDIVADLRGQIDIELAGKVDTVHGGSLRTTFEGVPDAPVTKFTLSLAGGAKGLLQNSTPLCGSGKRALVQMTGQNGAEMITKPKLKVSCGSGKARHRRHANGGRRAGA